MNRAGETRRQALKLAALGAGIGVLVALGFALRQVKTAESPALTAHDSVRAWSQASPQRKREAAEKVLDELREAGVLGPQTRLAMAEPQGRERLIAEVIEALDAATNRNVTDYVSPGQSMIRTARAAAARKGWNK